MVDRNPKARAGRARLVIQAIVLIPAMALAIVVPASAAEDFAKDLGRVVGAFMATQLYAEQCDLRDPDGAPTRRDVLAGWSFGNDRQGYDRLIEGVVARAPEVAAQFGPQRDRLAGLIEQDIEADPAQCEDLLKVFDDDSQFSVGSIVRRLLRQAGALGIEVPAVPEIVPPIRRIEGLEILRLATLSARLEGKMAEIGSREGGRRQRDLARARAHHAENWLAASGLQVLFGRVASKDRMREWRGGEQSVFEVECDSFMDDAHRDRMAEAIGQDRVVVAMPDSVLERRNGGRLTLKRCGLFTPEEAGRPFAEEDDTAGLMPRPLDVSEAYGGPGTGITMRDVDRVLYEASFDSRMDGYGNGYIDRREAVYVLLRDGSAYRHEWSFPITDLAVELSRQREPGRWFTWAERGGQVSLTGRSGEGADDVLVLKATQRLRPMRPGPLEARYDYLQVGMGGFRQDRSFAFSQDSTVRYHQSGFVAGNVATGHLTVNGPAAPSVTARYRFEDYALILEHDGGSDRYFFAVPEGADDGLPDTVLIRGRAYWLDKDDAGPAG